jgi:uncharacterized membrane protein
MYNYLPISLDRYLNKLVLLLGIMLNYIYIYILFLHNSGSGIAIEHTSHIRLRAVLGSSTVDVNPVKNNETQQ